MSNLAPILEAFFTERLLTQRQASPRTVAAYRDTFRLLLNFVHEQIGKAPSQVDIAELDAPLIGAFLDWLEHDRHNGVRTRNARLAAIHSLFRYASFRHPEHANVIQRVLAIPSKRYERSTIDFLNQDEIDALLAAIDRTKWGVVPKIVEFEGGGPSNPRDIKGVHQRREVTATDGIVPRTGQHGNHLARNSGEPGRRSHRATDG